MGPQHACHVALALLYPAGPPLWRWPRGPGREPPAHSLPCARPGVWSLSLQKQAQHSKLQPRADITHDGPDPASADAGVGRLSCLSPGGTGAHREPEEGARGERAPGAQDRVCRVPQAARTAASATRSCLRIAVIFA